MEADLQPMNLGLATANVDQLGGNSRQRLRLLRHAAKEKENIENIQERLATGTQRTTGLMVGYEVIKVSRLLSRPYVRVATLNFIRLWVGSQWRFERS